MDAPIRWREFSLALILSFAGLAVVVQAQLPASQPLPPQSPGLQPPQRQAPAAQPPTFQSPALQPAGVASPAATAPPAAQGQQAAHPLDAELQLARERLGAMQQNIKDYSCVFTKRERVNGKLLPYEQMFMKVRHQPFSVYMYFLGPEEVKGQQVVYVEGQNSGKMIAQPVGLKGKFGPYHLDPNGRFAMEGQRYPITNAGFVNLTIQLINEGIRDRQYPQCEVKQYKGAKVAGRTCTVTEIIHPQLPQFEFHKARIFVDDELNIPIRLESYLWPEQPGGEPLPLEEYTYTNLKFNNGFTDADFVIREQ